MQAAQKTFISSTNWTERIGPVAALATIRKHQRVNAGDHLKAIGERIQQGLKTVAENNEIKLEVTGIPPLTHFSFQTEKPLQVRALYVQLMLEQGFLATNLFYAMYAHSPAHVQNYLQAADFAFAEITNALFDNDVEGKLRGEPAVAGFKRLN